MFVFVCCADDLSVVKCLVQLTLTVTRHHSSTVELCRDIARDLHICVGDIDQVRHFVLLLLLLHMMIIVKNIFFCMCNYSGSKDRLSLPLTVKGLGHFT